WRLTMRVTMERPATSVRIPSVAVRSGVEPSLFFGQGLPYGSRPARMFRLISESTTLPTSGAISSARLPRPRRAAIFPSIILIASAMVRAPAVRVLGAAVVDLPVGPDVRGRLGIGAGVALGDAARRRVGAEREGEKSELRLG